MVTQAALDGTTAGEGQQGPADVPRPRRAVLGRWAQAAVLLVPAAVAAERAWDRRWMTDDGFINLRIARMILDGHGPVFNVGERVEAATSTLWVWAVVAGDVVLPLPMEWVAVVLGLAGTVAGVALATFGAARLHRGRGAGGVLVPLGAAVLVALPPFWEFSTSGLEGGLTFAWIGLTGWLLARWATSGDRFGGVAAVVVGAAPLVRPDLAVAVPVVLGGVLAAQWDGDRGRDRVRLVALALALPVAYQVFRMGYYGSLVPNTALAKSGGRGLWGNGWGYTRDLAQPYWLVVPLACLALAVLVPFGARAWHARDRRGLVALAALPVVGAADGLYVVRVGGDYMHGRLLLPALFALVAPVAAVPVTGVARAWTAGPGRRAALGAPVVGGAEPGTAGPGGARPDDVDGADPVATGQGGPRHGRPAARRGRALLPPAVAATAVVVVAWALVAGSTLRRDPDGVVADLFVGEAYEGQRSQYGPGAVTARDQGWDRDRVRDLFPPGIEVRLPEPLPGAKPRDGGGSRPVYASYGIGVGGYALGDGVYVLDMLGLADPLGSRFELERPGSTGHEKPIPAAWLAARVSDRPVPRASLPEPPIVIPLYESPPGRFHADTEAARRTLGCGGLVDLGHAVHDRLTPGRFLRNLVGSLALTRLTVPADPAEAERQLCG